ncbi:molybdenum ABC transporter ATP-binding protein [Rhodospirillum rubrum]|uniref:molybdenum ABC transporter ATP-binding protein n=1 Tax=Rhodospirillum rubrum TaxID=1085 RepID=UPI0019074BDF|nr:molybdenum ABC transporter ATP-binding protein [Rhodospirillum rubrum]MBK1664011.1 molybdenum ABC transporter ATP-binding protein [Rhodospirillum rubrum]MBK1675431.1 molybdenum ABC transporter ATP-binding protein [Rhodospirillum rubrum]
MLDIDVLRQQGALRLSIAFRAGKGVTALFGRSGAGKTSVISMVAGLSRPDGGRIVVDDRVLFDGAKGIDLAPEKRRVGYVFQEGRLFPHLTVRQNLAFGMNRVSAAERYVGEDDVVDLLGIGALLDRRPAKLSGGEKQRVAIGRALLASPRILLMDEPLASLDAQRKDEVLPFIARLPRRFSIPILYVSHAMDEVLRLADTLVLIAEGQVAASGPLEEVLARPDIPDFAAQRDAGAVVAAKVAGRDIPFGATLLDTPAGLLRTRPLDLPLGTKVRVRIAAADISLALERPRMVSVQNILAATILAIGEPEDGRLSVDLDAGPPGGPPCRLWASITARARHDLGLVPGLRVHALIKAMSLLRDDLVEHSPH